MKKLLFIALTAFSAAHAQQTITGTSAIGYSVNFAAATPATASTVPIGATGANVTWNCSNLATNNQVFTLNISSPSSQPYFSDYPSSNWNLNAVVMGTTVVNEFFILTADSLVKLGGHVAGSSYEIYNNPQLDLKFPFNYGDVEVNTYGKTSYNANGSVSSTQTGSVTLSYEGYGTLVLPVGTFTNVAMLKRVRTNSIGPTTTSYSWVKYPSGERLMEYDNNGSIKVNYAYSQSATGLAEFTSDKSIIVYPTVTDKMINIQTSEKIETIKVYDSKGQPASIDVNESAGTYSFEIKGNPGLYFVEVLTKDTGRSKYYKIILN